MQSIVDPARIWLDMTLLSANRSVELLALMTNDMDCIPAMKFARRAGLHVALMKLPGSYQAKELYSHVDFRPEIV